MEGQNIERLREILARLRDERKIVRQELFEIETWLNTVGKRATHKNDKAVRTQFMKDKDRLIKKTHSLKVEIKEYADAIEQMVEGRRVGSRRTYNRRTYTDYRPRNRQVDGTEAWAEHGRDKGGDVHGHDEGQHDEGEGGNTK